MAGQIRDNRIAGIGAYAPRNILQGRADTSNSAMFFVPLADDEDLARTAADVARILKAKSLGGEPVPQAELHCTLLYLEGATDEALDTISRRVRLPLPFPCRLLGLSRLGDAIVALIDPDPSLVRLQRDLWSAAKMVWDEVSFSGDRFSDPGQFTPHVSFAYKIPDALGLEDFGLTPGILGPEKRIKVDKIAVCRDEFQSTKTIRLPSKLGDRVFVTQGGQHATPLEVTRAEWKGLVAGGTVFLENTRRMVTLNDGPFTLRGGPESGFHGHEGRPGERGGSAPSGEPSVHDQVKGHVNDIRSSIKASGAKGLRITTEGGIGTGLYVVVRLPGATGSAGFTEEQAAALRDLNKPWIAGPPQAGDPNAQFKYLEVYGKQEPKPTEEPQGETPDQTFDRTAREHADFSRQMNALPVGTVMHVEKISGAAPVAGTWTRKDLAGDAFWVRDEGTPKESWKASGEFDYSNRIIVGHENNERLTTGWHKPFKEPVQRSTQDEAAFHFESDLIAFINRKRAEIARRRYQDDARLREMWGLDWRSADPQIRMRTWQVWEWRGPELAMEMAALDRMFGAEEAYVADHQFNAADRAFVGRDDRYHDDPRVAYVYGLDFQSPDPLVQALAQRMWQLHGHDIGMTLAAEDAISSTEVPLVKREDERTGLLGSIERMTKAIINLVSRQPQVTVVNEVQPAAQPVTVNLPEIAPVVQVEVKDGRADKA